jgi:hypothetical protein
MSWRIYQSNYKNVPAVVMESGGLTACFLPQYGGKLASLVCKKTGREFLAQNESAQYKVLQYDGDYVTAECSGFDDMFPTIDKIYYTQYPWKGVEIPDHGEVCGLPWECVEGQDCLYMGVNGVRFPYRLEKWISFKGESVLSIQYRATNLSSFDMDFLWAAHTMLNIENGGEIILPYKDKSPATCIFSEDPGFGARGYKLEWPLALRMDGTVQALNITGPKNANGNCYKYYFDQKTPEGWCAYKYNSDGTIFKTMFSKETVPYLSLWVNEGSFHNLHNIAMEVCTGTYDRPDLARMYGQNSVLKAKSTYEWYYDIYVEVQ